MSDTPNPAEVARLFHEHYERLAPEFGYRTRDASAVPWSDVPADNKGLMIATVRAVFADLRATNMSRAVRILTADEAAAGLRVVPVSGDRQLLDAEERQAIEELAQTLEGPEDAALFSKAMHLRVVDGRRAANALRFLEAAVSADPTPSEPTDEQHLIQFTDDGWTIAHPIRERLDLDSLFDCRMRWDHDDPGVRGRFVLNDDGTLGEEIQHG